MEFRAFGGLKTPNFFIESKKNWEKVNFYIKTKEKIFFNELMACK